MSATPQVTSGRAVTFRHCVRSTREETHLTVTVRSPRGDLPDLPPLSKNPERKDNDSEERRGNNYLIDKWGHMERELGSSQSDAV